ncbi:hypothetical protein A9Q84_00310 [Halobacteriovorax marinus]|uniref:Peptidase S1 domain-containing protein n=1 Tax=Halobacteriovorax marinus TaxID=97084 RepID=A0A1Y5FFH4_9BACT|nr:hypothetical protein A9Q84_00310 [Halobacteriovorax marinus]
MKSVLKILLLVSFVIGTVQAERHPTDDRLVKGPNSPRFLDAVGRLKGVHSVTGNINWCGASLVAFTPNQRSRVIVTSSHCLKANDITWSTTTKSGKVVKRKVIETIDRDGNFDYAFLLLESFVETEDVMPLIIDFESGNSVTGMVNSYKADVHVAGYSADIEVGKGGTVLTYDTTYDYLMSVEDSRRHLVGGISDGVTTYAGASGGAVILSFEDETNEINLGVQHVLGGIIKGGVSNDFTSSNGIQGSNNTRFVYYERFAFQLYDTLVKYNGAVEGIEW